MKHALIFMAIFLSILGGQIEAAKNHPKSIKVELHNANIDGYWVHLPYNYNTEQLWPLLVFFHGSGLLEKSLDAVEFEGPFGYALKDTSQSGELRNQILANFIILSPHLRGTGKLNPLHTCTWAKEVRTIDAIIDTVLNLYSCNEEKIYLTGLSLGGSASWLLPNVTKHRIAAIVPICGSPQGPFKNDPRRDDKTSKNQPNYFLLCHFAQFLFGILVMLVMAGQQEFFN